MPSIHKAIYDMVVLVDEVGRSRPNRARYQSWATAEPLLGRWPDLSTMAAEARAADPHIQDATVAALLRVAGHSGELAPLAVVAILSRGLGAVVARWARAGTPDWELADLEADLVAETWLTVVSLVARMSDGSPVPPRVGLWIVGRAAWRVRNARRGGRRTGSRRPRGMDRVASAGDRPVPVALAGEIVAAVRACRISPGEARCVFWTRVLGFDVTEAARRTGCSPEVFRAVRSKAERRLVGFAA